MFKGCLFVIMILHITVKVYTQIGSVNQTAFAKKYFKTFFSMQQYLQEHQIVSLPHPESKPGIYSAGEVFYDTVINRFFNVPLMTKYLSRDTNYFSLNDKVQLIRYYLNVFDRSLDSLPPNYYHVEMNTEKDMIDEVKLQGSIVNVYWYNSGVKTTLVMILFDPETAKCLNVVPVFQTSIGDRLPAKIQ